ncbi:MAG: cytochrome C oxidase subunit IV family protein [Planctomycetota bacterium]|jgi:cytochrome c oxidase subunit IV
MSEAAAAHADDHAHENHDPLYWKKFWWLLGLTVAEVLVAVMLKGHGMEGVRVAGLATFALWKAAIVMQHYMHLSAEPRGLKLLLLFPGVLILVLIFLVSLDGHILGYAAGN